MSMKVCAGVAIAISILFSCNTPQTTKTIDAVPPAPPAGRLWNIALQNNLGNVHIYLPKHFDTLFSWTQRSDCGEPCERIDYRVQPASLPVFEESGWFYFPLKDSVEQFTIKHSKLNYAWQGKDSLRLRYLRERLNAYAYKDTSEKYIVDTFIQSGHITFPVVAFTNYDKKDKAPTQYVNAMVLSDSNLLEIFFEYRKSYSDSSKGNFIERAVAALKTISFSK